MIERASEFGNSTASAPLIPSDSINKTAGDMLREAREAHNLHIDVVAAALKVPTQKLQALEDDDIDSLPDAVFARALAASVCRALRIDPAPVLAKLPGALRPGLADADRTISTSFRSGAPRSGRNGGGQPSRTVLVVVALLLIGAAALFWLPQGIFGRLSTSLSGAPASGEAAPASADAPPSSESASVPAGTVIESVTATPAAEAASAAVQAPGGVAGSTAAAVTGDVLVFNARAESWITVNEAGGKQLLRRTLKPGETVGLSGKLPLSVVVGRAAGMDVTVRGQPFDLTPLAKSGGVARFEVKP